jgi:hypothetical protein
MHFPGPNLSRLAFFLTILALAIIATGAMITSGGTAPATYIDPRIHVGATLLAAVLTLAMMVMLAPSNTRIWLRSLGWIAVGTLAIEAGMGVQSAMAKPILSIPLPLWLALVHACLAPLYLASLAAVAYFTWPENMLEPDEIDISPAPHIRLLARLAPPLVLLQIALGATYRHKLTGVMLHMGGAMLVALTLLVLTVVLLQQFPGHKSLKPIAIATMSVLLLQVALGIGAFVMRLLDFDTGKGFVHLAASHVSLGALTLAASVILAIEIRRCIPAAE